MNKPPAAQAALKAELLQSMADYMNRVDWEEDEDDEDASAFEPGYNQAHIERCDAILSDYLRRVFDPAAKRNRAAILSAVKDAVQSLNVLNAECEGSLIETDQREQICQLIIESAELAGLQSEVYDITEAWREEW